MNRRHMLRAAGLSGLGAAATIVPRNQTAAAGTSNTKRVPRRSPFVTAPDDTQLFVQDWGAGRPIVFLAAWVFNANAWGAPIAALTSRGFRCIAPDRRGHGRSETPASGYDADTLAGDLAAVIDRLDLSDAVLVAHSMGSIEAVRYLATHGSSRIAKLVLAAPVTPFLRKTEDNPNGIPSTLMEAQYQDIAQDYAKWIGDNEAPFFTSDTVLETRNWIKSMMLSIPLPVALACRRTIAAADLRAEMGKIDLPALIIHGDKDASAPMSLTGAKSATLIRGSRLAVYEGAPHALTLTHGERFIADVLSFIAT